MVGGRGGFGMGGRIGKGEEVRVKEGGFGR